MGNLHPWDEVESDEDFVFPGHVADDPPQGERQFPDESRGSEHQIDQVLGLILVDVDNFKLIPPFRNSSQIFLMFSTAICERRLLPAI